MRTVRTKVYKFIELKDTVQEQVIYNEAKRFNSYFSLVDKGFLNPHELEAAKARIIKNKQEFTSNGKVFNQ